MSTYNGEKYIGEQIESILAQEGVSIEILIRDDNSSDSTRKIIRSYIDKHNNIRIYDGLNKGACQSFLDLLNNASGADFYAFSDQDDVWDNNKVYSAIKKLSEENCELPLLYYSNLRVVDKDLTFKRLAHDKKRNIGKKYTSLAEAAVAGCTMVFNQKALDILKNRTPKDCSMHDSWVFLVCMMFGKVVYDETPHISYRQHEENVIGAYQGKKTPALYLSKIRELFESDEPRLRNAKALLEEYEDQLSDKDKRIVKKLINYKKRTGNRFKLLFDFRIHATSVNREIRYLAGILLKNL